MIPGQMYVAFMHANVPSSHRILQARTSLLAASPSNAASLEEIESAMIIVPLDDITPITREDASWASWVGDGRNRFYDKHQRMSSGLGCKFLRSLEAYSDCV